LVFPRVAVLVLVVLLLLLVSPSRRILCSPRCCSILCTCLPPGVIGESSMSHCIVARARGTLICSRILWVSLLVSPLLVRAILLVPWLCLLVACALLYCLVARRARSRFRRLRIVRRAVASGSRVCCSSSLLLVFVLLGAIGMRLYTHS